MHDIENELIKSSKIVLKKEWERVKRGEHVYKIAKAIAIFVVLIGCSMVFVWFVKSYFST